MIRHMCISLSAKEPAVCQLGGHCDSPEGGRLTLGAPCGPLQRRAVASSHGL